MRHVRPKLKAETITLAEEQDEYKPVTVAVVSNPGYPGARGTPYNTLVMAFEITPEERQRLIDGGRLYVSLLTMLQPMQPILCSIGDHETAEMFGVEVEE